MKARPDGVERHDAAPRRRASRCRAAPSRSSTAQGRTLLAEKTGGGKTLTPAQVMGETTFHVQAEFEPQAGRGALRPGRAPERLDELRRPRRRHVPAQHRRHRAVPRRRAAATGCCGTTRRTRSSATRASPCTCRRRTSTTPRAGRAASPARTARATARRGTVVATRVDRADRVRRAGGPAGDLGDPQRAAGHERRSSTRSSRRATPASSGTAQIESERRRRLRPPDVREQRRAAVARRQAASSTPGARAGCRGGTRSGCSLGAKAAAPQIRLEWRREEGEGTLRLKWKTPPRTAAHVALVGGRRRHRLLLRLRPRPRRRRRRLPRADRAARRSMPALGARPVAEPRALPDGAGEPRHARRVPEARHPARHDRAWTGSTGRPDQWGSHAVRPRALPRPRGLDPARSTSARTRGS